uniref:Leucine-rich repeat-containing N-terminal plant-type domain-containing protein n=1 Tax=Daucus carota subsp. sativus TaxID=79200 RepID=A0A161ZXP7_DAUCS
MEADQIKLTVALCMCLVSLVISTTDPNDLAILKQFSKGLSNAEVLKWPNNDDPCGPPSWPHIFCTGNRVSQIQVQGLNLKGPLPQNFNQLSMLTNVGLQKNNFTGNLPSFSGLSRLRYAYLDFNNFDTIPSDFFRGLDGLEVLALDNNPLLNKTAGWLLPVDLQNSAQLANLSLMDCNLAGVLPDFLGQMSSLEVLKLSFNRLSGGIPVTFQGSVVRILWLNEQSGGASHGMSGTIDVVASMSSLTSLWLHGNHFSGKIPKNIGDLASLQELNLNSNDFVGLIPDTLATIHFKSLDLNNNHFMGPIPRFKGVNASYRTNSFCQNDPGLPCAPEVMALLEFLDGVNYPPRLVSSWSGNNPCDGPWLGLICNANREVTMINLPKFNLSGNLSPSIANLHSVSEILLSSNNLTGRIPASWVNLKSLKLLDVSGNNLSPPIPRFDSSVKLNLNGNPLLNSNKSSATAPPDNGPSPEESMSLHNNSTSESAGLKTHTKPSKKKRPKLVMFVVPVATFGILIFMAFPLSIYLCKKRRNSIENPTSLLVHPKDLSDSDNLVKVVVESNNQGSASTLTGSSLGSRYSSGMNSHITDTGNMIVSVQVLRKVTNNFAPENELGRGVTGKVTTKADVFSFGVVLMELLTGLMALDEERPEESQYLAAWFWNIKSSTEKLKAAIDPALDMKEEIFESICTIAELAGHCTAREPNQRPEMGHAVNVLSPLVEKWKPLKDEIEEYCGIDYSLPLNQMVKGWQEAEGNDLSFVDLEDSRGSIPSRPAGFADSFTSTDGR